MDEWTDGRTDRRRVRGRIGMIGKAASYSLFGAAITKVRATRRERSIDRSIGSSLKTLSAKKRGAWLGSGRTRATGVKCPPTARAMGDG